MPLRPNQVVNLIVASVALALLAEGALLWKLSGRAPQNSALKPTLAPNSTPNPTPFLAPTPLAAPIFTAPAAPPKKVGAPQFSVPKSAKTSTETTSKSPPIARLSDENRARAKTYFEAATAALQAKKPALALENFRRVVPIAPDHLPTRLNLALLYLGANQPAQAIPHLKKAAQLDPKAAAPRFQLAQAYLALRQPQLALAPLRETIAIAPKERAAHGLLAQVYLALKKPREAYREWTFLAQSEPRDVEAHLQAANLAAGALNLPREAEKWLVRAQKLSPKDPRAALLLAQLFRAEKQPARAAKVLASAAQTAPDVFEIYPALAEARLGAGDLSGARGALQTALTKLPRGATGDQKARISRAEGELRLSLGRVLGQQKQPKAARIEFKRAAQLLPREAEPQALLALAALQSGDKNAAKRALQSALALDPNRARDRLTLAGILAQDRDFRGAETQFAAYLKAAPRDLNALSALAQVKLQLKKPAEAAQILAKIADLDPKNPLPLLDSGAILRDAGQFAPALASFERALARRPTDERALVEVARLQTRLKRGGAGATWQKLIAVKPGFLPAYGAFLEVSARGGQEIGARLFLARQLARGAENPSALSEILRFYARTGRDSQAKALLADITQRNPKNKAARAALDSFAPPKLQAARPTPQMTPTVIAPNVTLAP